MTQLLKAKVDEAASVRASLASSDQNLSQARQDAEDLRATRLPSAALQSELDATKRRIDTLNTYWSESRQKLGEEMQKVEAKQREIEDLNNSLSNVRHILGRVRESARNSENVHREWMYKKEDEIMEARMERAQVAAECQGLLRQKDMEIQQGREEAKRKDEEREQKGEELQEANIGEEMQIRRWCQQKEQLQQLEEQLRSALAENVKLKERFDPDCDCAKIWKGKEAEMAAAKQDFQYLHCHHVPMVLNELMRQKEQGLQQKDLELQKAQQEAVQNATQHKRIMRQKNREVQQGKEEVKRTGERVLFVEGMMREMEADEREVKEGIMQKHAEWWRKWDEVQQAERTRDAKVGLLKRELHQINGQVIALFTKLDKVKVRYIETLDRAKAWAEKIGPTAATKESELHKELIRFKNVELNKCKKAACRKFFHYSIGLYRKDRTLKEVRTFAKEYRQKYLESKQRAKEVKDGGER